MLRICPTPGYDPAQGGQLPTAAVLIIGDEILTGKFADENGPWLITRLRALGVDLRRLVHLRDVVEDIAAEVAACSAAYDHVFTTGGVGPTHDDITLDGIAAAFALPMEQRSEIVALMVRYGMELNAMTLRMATLPQQAEIFGLDRGYPIVRVRNVYVFPGVPRIMKQKFEAIAASIAGPTVCVARIYADDEEHDIAVHLAAVAARYPDVAVGSYPRHGEATGILIVTFEGSEPDVVRRCRDDVAAGLRVRAMEGPS